MRRLTRARWQKKQTVDHVSPSKHQSKTSEEYRCRFLHRHSTVSQLQPSTRRGEPLLTETHQRPVYRLHKRCRQRRALSLWPAPFGARARTPTDRTSQNPPVLGARRPTRAAERATANRSPPTPPSSGPGPGAQARPGPYKDFVKYTCMCMYG